MDFIKIQKGVGQQHGCHGCLVQHYIDYNSLNLIIQSISHSMAHECKTQEQNSQYVELFLNAVNKQVDKVCSFILFVNNVISWMYL